MASRELLNTACETMNYYPRHIGDYLTATAHLSLLEHGVYARLLDVYYTREAPIPDGQAERLCGARTPEEREAVRAVLEEFFEFVDGEWRQARCDEEIAKYRDKSGKAKASAAASVNARKANAERTLSERSTDVELTNNQNHIPTSLRSVGRARATRLPPDWEPSDLDWGNACIALHTTGAKRELEKFRDYWAAKAGAGGTKADWDATWRNWVRKAGEYAENRGTGERLSAVERVRRDSEEWARKRTGGDCVLAANGEPIRAQMGQPIRLVAGRTVDEGADDVGF